jgi:hypothetical protein
MKEAVEAIHVRCVRALRNYMAEANKTCKLLTSIRSFPIDPDVRHSILTQRRAENRAQQAYQLARRDLFEAANWPNDEPEGFSS